MANKILIGQNGNIIYLDGVMDKIISLDNVNFMTYK